MENYEDYEDLVDDTEDDFEQSQDLQDAQQEQLEATYPQLKEKPDIYQWFWKVVRLDKPFKLAKVGNLNKAEIGEHGVSMRDSLNLAHLGQIFHHGIFGDYWATRSKIISASSMAKGGWFMELSISQKKLRERTRKKSSQQQEKWKLFGKKNTTNSQEE